MLLAHSVECEGTVALPPHITNAGRSLDHQRWYVHLLEAGSDLKASLATANFEMSQMHGVSQSSIALLNVLIIACGLVSML